MDKPTDDLPKQKPIKTAPKASDLIGKAVSRPSTESTPTSSATGQSGPSPVEPLRMELLEKLWATMTETYGHRWTSSFGENPRADHAWAKHLTGLNGRQIANGLSKLSEMDNEGWPPSATQFRSMCLKVDDLPSHDEAWIEALKGVYSHEVVRVAAEATGVFDLREAEPNNKALRNTFERNYAITLRRLQNGQQLDGGIAKAISHDTKTPSQIQFAASHREARELIAAQGIPTDPKAARALLLAKMGIKRSDKHV